MKIGNFEQKDKEIYREMLVISRGIIFSNTVYILYHVHEIIDSEEEEEEEEDTSEGSRKLHE